MNNYEIVKFVDGDFQLDVRTDKENETVWLTLDEIGEVFGRDRSVIGKHIKNILNNSELDEKSVRAKFARTALDGKKYNVDYYNLDMILAVGYRVNSRRGTQLRISANVGQSSRQL